MPRDDLSPLFCPGEATAGVLCTILDSPVQDRQGSPRESPVEGHKDGEGPGVSPVWGTAEGPGAVQSGEDWKRILAMLISICSAGFKRMRPGSFQWCPEQGAMGTNWNTGRKEEKLLYCEGDRALEQTAQRLWSLLLWRYSEPPWTLTCVTCCIRGVLDSVMSRGPFQPQWFYDIHNLATTQQGAWIYAGHSAQAHKLLTSFKSCLCKALN